MISGWHVEICCADGVPKACSSELHRLGGVSDPKNPISTGQYGDLHCLIVLTSQLELGQAEVVSDVLQDDTL